ncbi:MAG: hypothetical protein JNM34_07235 [Chthonomonadaceae bacterium]|nr:hypothetical protein [Chthonomonadaceae bacterium]
MKKTLTIIIALVAVSSIAFAQQGGGQRGQGGGKGQGQGQKQGGQNQRQGGGNGAARLLAMPSVQTELNLTSDQKSKIAALLPQRGQGGQAGGQRGQGGQGGGQRGQGGSEQGANRTNQADLDKKIAEILDDKQEARLAELVIQRAGNRAVLNETVASKLAVTADQKTQLAALREKQRAGRQGGGQQGQGADREAARAAREKMEKELDAEIGKILTEKQKVELKALGGKPFKFDN